MLFRINLNVKLCLSIDKHINVIGCHIIIIKSASGFEYVCTWYTYTILLGHMITIIEVVNISAVFKTERKIPVFGCKMKQNRKSILTFFGARQEKRFFSFLNQRCTHMIMLHNPTQIHIISNIYTPSKFCKKFIQRLLTFRFETIRNISIQTGWWWWWLVLVNNERMEIKTKKIMSRYVQQKHFVRNGKPLQSIYSVDDRK